MTKTDRKITIEFTDSAPASLHQIALAIAEQYQKERRNAKCKVKKSTASY